MAAVKTRNTATLMTEGSIVKSLLLFALPLIFGNLLQQMYNTADSIIVGNFVGSNALAAVGSSGSPIYLLIGFSQGLAVGAGVVVSQYLGAGDHKETREAVHTSLAIAVVMGLLLTVGGVACGRALLVAMNTPAEVLADAVTYIRIYFGGVLFSVVYNMTAGILNAAGNSRRSLVYLAWASVTNIVLDLLFIVPFKMGILGAALATDISQAISGVVSFGFLCRKFEVLHMQKGELAFSKRACTRLMGIGVPMGLQCSITAIGSVIMQWAVNVLGSTAVAAVTAASKTMNLLTVPLESIGTAMATYSGQNLGAARMDRVRKGVTSALLIATVYSIASAFILHFADVAVMSLFLDTTTEVEIVAMGREYLFWNSVFFVPLGALIVWRYSIQGLGFSTLAMMAGVAEMIARTAVAIVLVPMLGYFGAELANPAAWIAACIFLYPAYRWTCRQLDNRLLAAKLHIQGNHAETVL